MAPANRTGLSDVTGTGPGSRALRQISPGLFFRAAAGALPATDRPSMVSAELMGGIYHRILRRMRADGFRVFERRYRLSKAEMLARLIRAKLGF